jgi:4-hydroxy-tetrahydrodipicolinate synthase
MKVPQIHGIFAALLTLRKENAELDEIALRGYLEFLFEKGVRGFAVNGATGEFCLTTKSELSTLLSICRSTLGNQATFLCGIGSPSLKGIVDLGKVALDAGVTALLLPMPHFFVYDQSDLDSFCREAARQLPAPLLLYNLPKFATGLDSSTVVRLIRECPNIIGIKDSSGSLDTMRVLTELRLRCSRIVGNDAALAQALAENLCDGVVSGVAGVLPELIRALFNQNPKDPLFKHLSDLLSEFLSHMEGFPAPWGLKWIAESRNICPAIFSLPISPRRQQEALQLGSWFTEWYSRLPTNM